MNNYTDYYNYMHNVSHADTINKKKHSVKLDYNTEPYEGFCKGNMFSNIYDPYQNYKPQELDPTNEQEYLLLLVQIYEFAAHDLGLYLDVNPDDKEAIKLRSDYIDLYNQSLTNYESMYGPLSLDSQMLDATPWVWDSKKWPWEGDK